MGNFCYFPIKTDVVGTRSNRLGEAINIRIASVRRLKLVATTYVLPRRV